ncbi:MAG TPA: DUF5916 domain-containing protein [Gemmatimonadales bacterium]|nr:DUF5916 domain-containing protein [Gemmatimonadales bacterium]
MRAVLSLLLLAHFIAPASARPDSCWQRPAEADSSAAIAALRVRTAHASRAGNAAPTLDGRLDDPAWCRAAPFTASVMSSPAPGAIASLPTVTRVLFDDDAIYVGVRLWDPAPDSILAPYPRRDDETTSDWVFVELDTRHDRRSGFSFGLNPRAVQVDGLWYDDVDYDAAWNGVWQGASTVDSAGWSAEFRIPYSQLALGAGAPGTPLTWGINVYRYTPHRGESSNWSPRLPSVAGIVSHFNQLDGIVVPPGHAPFDALPYVAVSGSRTPASTETRAAAGADLRYRLSPSAVAALSLHPDFGQVEADPSQVNLTTFETFFPEQRPLFLESAQSFQFGAPLVYHSRGTTFDQESPFYSRRIGRTTSDACPAGAECSRPGASSVLGAFRMSARTTGGWSAALLNAWTDDVASHGVAAGGQPFSRQADPVTQATAARVTHESGDGRSALGAIGTWITRFGMHDGASERLAQNAVLAGLDGRTRFGDDAWELTGSVLGSRVDGSAPMIQELERRHGYARPDSVGVLPDSLVPATSMSGMAAQVEATRTHGSLKSGVAARLVTRGFESNDAGFQRNADWLLVTGSWTWLRYRPGHRIRRWSIGSSQLGAGWTLGGLRRSGVANLTGELEFRNYWGGTLAWDHEFGADDPEVLRGGPAFRLPPRDRVELTAHSDSRTRWQATLDVTAEREAATRSHRWEVSSGITAFITDRLQLGLTPMIGFTREGWQYVGTPMDQAGVPHYLLGRLHQTTASLTARGTYAFSAHLTVQLYGQLFLSDGWYDAPKEVVAPRASDPGDRVRALGDTQAIFVSAADFSDRELHVNAVLRWEFLPGSTLFLVWTHAREADDPAAFSLGHDVSTLLDAPATNALQAKVSYWIGQ